MTPSGGPRRIVSLVPSVTETLLHLGVVPVGCTRFCEQPGIPTVGGTKNPDIDAIVALQPDLVVVNDEENRREDAERLAAAGISLHDMSPRTVADVGPALVALAAVARTDPPPGAAPDAFAAWLARERERCSVPTVTACVFVWRRPWMTINAATYAASLLDLLGVRTVFAGCADRYPVVTLADVAGRNPDAVILPSEPYEFRPHHASEVATAVPATTIVFADGKDLFWWGTRTFDAPARLRTRLGL